MSQKSELFDPSTKPEKCHTSEHFDIVILHIVGLVLTHIITLMIPKLFIPPMTSTVF